jgi:cholest-4-en-3-one 26-monooxygenase
VAEPSIPPGFDFTDPELYSRRLPMDEFAELRRTAPVWWNPKPRGVGGFDDEGYWMVTRHADVVAVSRDSDKYSTWENTAIIRHRDGAETAALGLAERHQDLPGQLRLRRGHT